MTERSEQLAESLRAVRERIARAADDAGRDTGGPDSTGPDAITLIVVTKYFPADDVRILADLGVTDVAENRHQEALDKSAECADLGLRWHFVGGLQSNKAAAVTAYSSSVQSVDRRKLLGPLSRGAIEHRGDGPDLDVLLQVSLDPPDAAGARSGAAPDALDDLAGAVEAADGLRLRGLMAVAPLGESPRSAFERLRAVRDDFLVAHPAAQWLSAGMSTDLEDAVRIGATHVRVGSAVLGSRPRVQ